MRRLFNKVMACLLAVVLALGCFCTGGFVSYADSTPEIKIGDHVYMGTKSSDYSGIPYWRVIDKNVEDGSLLLLSEYLWLGNGQDPSAKIFFNSTEGNVEWKDSNAQNWCKRFEVKVLGNVPGLTIKRTTQSDSKYTSPDFQAPVIEYQAKEKILDEDTVFLLSAKEVREQYFHTYEERVAYLHDGSFRGREESWWLRSPRYLPNPGDITCLGSVDADGRVGKHVNSELLAMRPALWADMSNATVSGCTHDGKATWVVGNSNAQPVYGTPRYKWAADNSYCTAEVTCRTCGTTVSEKVASTSSTVEATAQSSGMTTYTVSFENSLFSAQTKKIYIPKKQDSGQSAGQSSASVKPKAPAEVIDLPAVKIAKPKAGKKAITVKWKKVSKKNQKKIQGIEIRYVGPGTDKTVTAGKKKTSKKIKRLISKKTYIVQVRAYANKGGVKHVSKWSKPKKVKIK